MKVKNILQCLRCDFCHSENYEQNATLTGSITVGKELSKSICNAVERAGLGSLHEGQKLSYELERDKRSGKMSAGQLQAL